MTRPASSPDDLLPGPMEARLTDIVVDEDRQQAKRQFQRLCSRIDGRGDLVDACLEAVNALHQRKVINDDIRIYLAMELVELWPFEQVDPELQSLAHVWYEVADLMAQWGDDADLDAPDEVKEAEWNARMASADWVEALEVRRLRLLGFDDVADLWPNDDEFLRRKAMGEAQLWSTIPLSFREEPSQRGVRRPPRRSPSVRATGKAVPVPTVRPPAPEEDDDWPGSRADQELEEAIRHRDREQSRLTFSAIYDQLFRDPERARDWIEAAHALNRRSVISRDALVYLANGFLGSSLFQDVMSDPESRRLMAQLDSLQKEIDAEGDLPEDHPKRLVFCAIADACGARRLALTMQRLRNWGFSEMAELMERGPEELDRMYEKGRIEVEGPEVDVRTLSAGP